MLTLSAYFRVPPLHSSIVCLCYATAGFQHYANLLPRDSNAVQAAVDRMYIGVIFDLNELQLPHISVRYAVMLLVHFPYLNSIPLCCSCCGGL
jgi:hypothetical protein